MHSTGTNPSRIICQTPGVFTLDLATSWNGNAALINRRIQLRLNAAGSSSGGTVVNTVDSASASTGAASIGNMSVPAMHYKYRFVNIGDYLELFVEQTSGSTVATLGGIGTYSQSLFEIA